MLAAVQSNTIVIGKATFLIVIPAPVAHKLRSLGGLRLDSIRQRSVQTVSVAINMYLRLEHVRQCLPHVFVAESP